MKKLFKYGLILFAAVFMPMLFQSCKDDKDIVIIDEELPLKVDHVYMVGDASPVGWNISDPFELTRDASNKYVFTYHGVLKTGEMKFPLAKGDWGGQFIYAPAANTEISANGVAKDGIDIRKGGDDLKWKVTKAGIYQLSLDLKTRKIEVKYEGAEPEKPLTSAWLTFIGDATPWGWNNDPAVMEKFQKTSDNPLQFTYEGVLKEGEFKVAFDQTDIPAWSNYLQAPEAGVTLNHEGVSKDGMVKGGEDNKWKVTEAGVYKLVFDLTNKKITVAHFDPNIPVVTEWDTKVLYMVGDATSAGWSAENPVTMTKSGDHLFTFEGELKVGELKFAPNKDGFSGSKPWFLAKESGAVINEHGASVADIVYGSEDKGTPDNKWKVEKAGKYKVTVDMTTHKIKVEYLGA